MNSNPSTIDAEEVAKFSAIADEWWDESGKFKPLHKFNPLRISYIRKKICHHFGRDENEDQPLKDLKILDIGCGGGLLSEPMARMGAEMTSIDASEKNIKVASIHAKAQNLDINYQHITVEELAEEKHQFDVILNMEVIEHVADVSLFMENACKLLKPNGLMFIATLNRTAKSYVFAIMGAEYVLRWLPRGTHDWKKFLKPSEINTELEAGGLKLQEIKGAKYNPLNDTWNLSNDVAVNYIMLAEKTSA